MTYCIDFFRKFKKEGNFCGLDKSQVSRLTAYLEIVEQLMKQKIPEEQIYQNFPVQAARPLISSSGTEHTDLLNKATTLLKEGKRIRTGDLREKLDKSNSPTEVKPKSWINPTLADKVRAAEMHEAAANHAHEQAIEARAASPSMFTTAAQFQEQQKKGIADEMFPAPAPAAAEPEPAHNPEWTPRTCRSGTCPDGHCHVEQGKTFGDKCKLSGRFLRDQDTCPIIEKRKRDAAAPQVCAATGGIIRHEHPPLIVKRSDELEEITVHTTPKEREWLRTAMRCENIDDPEMMIHEIITRSMEMQA